MCLELINTHKHIAHEDIPILKILKIQNGRFIAPYYHMIYKPNVLYKAYINHFMAQFHGSVNEGLHSFTMEGKLIAINEIKTMKSLCYVEFGLFNGIIPKGSEYYGTKDKLASNQLIITNQFFYERL